MKKLLTPLILAITLSSCASVYNDRSQETVKQDAAIQKQAYELIKTKPELYDTHLLVSSVRQTVLLTGQASTAAAKTYAGQVIGAIPGVKKLYNEIEIRGGLAPIAVANDAYLTSVAKSALAFKCSSTSNIKIITDDEVAYIIGANADQAACAYKTVDSVIGIKKTVNIPVV